MTRHVPANMAVVDRSVDIAPSPAPAAVEAGVAPAPRIDAGDGPSEAMSRLAEQAGRWTVRLLALLAGLALWHYASSRGLDFYVRFEHIPGPLRVGEALLGHLQASGFYLHIAASLRRIAISYALAAGIGIVLGLLMGRSRVIRDVVSPYIEILRPIPAVAWIPQLGFRVVIKIVPRPPTGP